jgi:hypothetical protein
MQINRSNSLNLLFPPVTPQPTTTKPASPTAAPVINRPATPLTSTAVVAPAAPKESGVIYTGAGSAAVQAPDAEAPDLDNMTLANQLELGRNRGVFTKITLSKDGVLVSKPHTDQGASASGFATSAAATIKDFEEGIASMRKHSPDLADKAHSGLAGKFRSLQQLTAKLNVFA